MTVALCPLSLRFTEIGFSNFMQAFIDYCLERISDTVLLAKRTAWRPNSTDALSQIDPIAISYRWLGSSLNCRTLLVHMHRAVPYFSFYVVSLQFSGHRRRPQARLTLERLSDLAVRTINQQKFRWAVNSDEQKCEWALGTNQTLTALVTRFCLRP